MIRWSEFFKMAGLELWDRINIILTVGSLISLFIAILPATTKNLAGIVMSNFLNAEWFWLLLSFGLLFVATIRTAKKTVDRDRREYNETSSVIQKKEILVELLHKLLDARSRLREGGMPENQQEEWNRKVEILLYKLDPEYQRQYKLNLQETTNLQQRILELEGILRTATS